ncbi:MULTISPECIES: ABC transporter ATP-binding protein [unclassified Tolypothrix]|uniref:ABC transporter ATP-binding protein n=1 Tax=unclassified Tolypothrix TaxID=2649714 RepID=UPI0005EABA6B|nr:MULTISPECIES: polysaccharide ABC transporter ATP-binding protein [unclassified Tolypothrix]BAY94726.1 ABC transporter-related protein [Microchaete diplosiphon NIES-3275]EKE99039.1 ABC superfamily ATP binding cassette [Tolypothrix sp. PCC 7601]MBE9081364.1 ATP-binding cassette domain-containing protein [Tolypothrix sp. LEGE 11397]UYD28416.1 ATP-binding cassette domain-containing protein [Tolypothrix sp. PCC 7712]UYD35705.1 ATP-binding cassette domain-containing protein [Tolypothrix sp. PCC 7
MSDVVINVENLGKKYILSHQQERSGRYRYKALRDVIADGAKSLAQRFIKPAAKELSNPAREEFWALNDVSFDIKQGEAIGIIGRNGAGKSTLLKVLSRITEPTTGRIAIKGRVASLLEVGTGFHPELTGRENIYLNGSVLGMSGFEIRKKFDEIVAFAEVEKFLDTPVKRYSSGMYVRLAFSVAAHLEPEILIVDEVLAVGDSSFQKKCLGKMGDVATKEGRTVLFVSHSMQAIAQLTQRCILLSKGKVQFEGNTGKAVQLYLAGHQDEVVKSAYYQAPVNKAGNYVAWAKVETSEGQGIHCWGKPIVFEFALHVAQPHESLWFSFQIVSALQQPICIFWYYEPQAPFRREPGTFIIRCEIPTLRLYMGSYTLTTWFSERRSETLLENLRGICEFEVSMHNFERPEYQWQPDECTYLEKATWKMV